MSLVVGLASCGATPAGRREPSGYQAQSAASFTRAAAVFQHPRCANCHPVDDFPRQGEEGRRHQLGVQRGPDNQGLPAMRCSTCHQDANQEHAGVPGAPHCNSGAAPGGLGERGPIPVAPALATAGLLRHTPRPTDEDINRSITNLCRCGTYERVRKAIHRAAGAPVDKKSSQEPG